VFPPETARPRLRARDRTPETARPRPHAGDCAPAGPAPAPGCVAGWARKTCVWIGIVLSRMPFRARGGLISRMGPVALMPGAAFAVHQLRYWLAFGNRAAVVLQAQGHSYLHSVVPWIVVLIALSAGIFLQALGRAFAGYCSVPRYSLSFGALWLLCAACLVAIYVSQELLEGLLATGHPAGLVGVFGYGGWWSVPAALAVGLVLAAVFHGARWVLRDVSRRFARGARARSGRTQVRVPRDVLLPRPAPLAGGWSGRGPPPRA
jgi:hypothetical protein